MVECRHLHFWIANSAVYHTPPCTALENATLVCLLETSSLPTSPPIQALMVLQLSRPPQGCTEVVAFAETPESAQTSQGTPMDIRSIGMVTTTGISSMSASRVVQDDTTRSIYMDTITASIRRVVLSGLDPDVSSAGPTIEI